MNREQINAAMQKGLVTATAINMNIEGARKNYDAACVIGNAVLADKIRKDLHALLDVQLDHSMAQMALAAKLMTSED